MRPLRTAAVHPMCYVAFVLSAVQVQEKADLVDSLRAILDRLALERREQEGDAAARAALEKLDAGKLAAVDAARLKTARQCVAAVFAVCVRVRDGAPSRRCFVAVS